MAPVAIQDHSNAEAPVVNLKQPQAAITTHNTKQDLSNLPQRPFERVWRGNKAGTIKCATIPQFDDSHEGKMAKRKWIKQHMAGAFAMWGREGYGEGVAGHITVRDPILPGHYWMNPFRVHFSAVTVDNLVLVTPDGDIHPDGAQLPINYAGFCIHSALHEARPEVDAAAHCHTVHGKAWSAFGKPLDMLNQDSCMFYDNLAVYKSFGGIVLAADEGKNIAEAMGSYKKAAILQNHGLMTVGHTVDEAAYLFAVLERTCKVQLMVEASLAGNPSLTKHVIDDEDAKFTAATLTDPEIAYMNMQPDYELLVLEKGKFFLGKDQ
ncbi:hypothetical protein OIO90_006525 [Microbotryomycetes sp. JL221]|nr:hypothetical protein OIO90_006525 [Microbotryomycetes sp. JL221]